MGETVRLVTRGSQLALRQAETVRRALERRNHAVSVEEVTTTGDRLDERLISELGKTGAFVRALDQRVLDGDADVAVHSLKDVPTEMPEAMVVAGVPERAVAGDVLVRPGGPAVDGELDRRMPSGEGNAVEALPRGAVVGTSSLRRQAHLRAERPGLSVEPLRGNVDTRIEKLLAPHLQRIHERRLAAADELPDDESDDDGSHDDGSDESTADGADSTPAFDEDRSYDRTPEEWFDDLPELARSAMTRTPETTYDAIVLAEAGLRRSDLRDHPAVTVERLPRSTFVPAPGQGALAVTATDAAVIDAVREALDHPPTRVTTTVERTVLATLGGGCVAPIGIHALLQGEHVRTRVRVSSRDGTEEVSATRELPVERHAEAAVEFGEELRERGAAELIERARREQPDDAKREE